MLCFLLELKTSCCFSFPCFSCLSHTNQQKYLSFKNIGRWVVPNLFTRSSLSIFCWTDSACLSVYLSKYISFFLSLKSMKHFFHINLFKLYYNSSRVCYKSWTIYSTIKQFPFKGFSKDLVIINLKDTFGKLYWGHFKMQTPWGNCHWTNYAII